MQNKMISSSQIAQKKTLVYKNAFFDLDGTLLETVQDISIALNEALEKAGVPYRYDEKETIRLIGNGAKVLVKKALRDLGDDEAFFSRVEALYMPLYKKYQNDHAKPFEGMLEALETMKKAGMRLFVVTNKPHALAQFIVKDHFGDLFDYIEGQREGVPLKPDPYQVNAILEKEGLRKEESIYVGDSIVDIQTGQSAKMDVALCGYGYGVYDEKTISKATYFLHKPLDLLDVVLK